MCYKQGKWEQSCGAVLKCARGVLSTCSHHSTLSPAFQSTEKCVTERWTSAPSIKVQHNSLSWSFLFGMIHYLADPRQDTQLYNSAKPICSRIKLSASVTVQATGTKMKKVARKRKYNWCIKNQNHLPQESSSLQHLQYSKKKKKTSDEAYSVMVRSLWFIW